MQTYTIPTRSFGFRMDNPSVLYMITALAPIPAPHTFRNSFGRTAKSTV